MGDTKKLTRRNAILSGENLTPLTREEYFAKLVASWNDVLKEPPVADGDYTFKVTVDDGKATYSWVSGGGGGSDQIVYVPVNIEEQEVDGDDEPVIVYTLTKTYNEILAYFEAGKTVIAVTYITYDEEGYIYDSKQLGALLYDGASLYMIMTSSGENFECEDPDDYPARSTTK